MTRNPHCWGIVLARTGNTSLCEARRLLGYASVQQDPAFDALRELEGAAGNTVILHFKYLDFVFPGSRFVLTTRPLRGWLQSMERSHVHNPRPIEGQHERIARRMAIYEAVGCEEGVLSSSFQRHHDEVRRYFAHRPSDLLELNIANGERWERLCPFLGVPQPDFAFPDLNRGLAR